MRRGTIVHKPHFLAQKKYKGKSFCRIPGGIQNGPVKYSPMMPTQRFQENFLKMRKWSRYYWNWGFSATFWGYQWKISGRRPESSVEDKDTTTNLSKVPVSFYNWYLMDCWFFSYLYFTFRTTSSTCELLVIKVRLLGRFGYISW